MVLSLELFTFAGTITQTSFDPSLHSFDSGISPEAGDPFTGTLAYLFDTSIVEGSSYDDVSISTTSRYWDLVEYIYLLTFEEFTIKPSIPRWIEIMNGEVSDSINFKAAQSAGQHISTGEEIDDFFLRFNSSTGTAFDGSGIPTSINSSAFDSGSLGFNFLTGVRVIQSGSPIPHIGYVGKIDFLHTQQATMSLFGKANRRLRKQGKK